MPIAVEYHSACFIIFDTLSPFLNARHQETCLILVDWLFFCICQNPLAMDLVLNLPNDGIRLVFDPVMQRLKVLIYFNLFLFICYFHNHTYSTPPCV